MKYDTLRHHKTKQNYSGIFYDCKLISIHGMSVELIQSISVPDP